MNDFIHLHTHTVCTEGNSSIEIEDMVRLASEFGMKATAIVDSGNIFGFDKFSALCRQYDIEPIYGCGFYLAENTRFDPKGRSHLVLLVYNEEGMDNLVELNRLAFAEGFHCSKAHIDDDLLEKYSRGLICLTGGNGGDIDKFIIAEDFSSAKRRALYYKSIYGDNFYLELQDHGLEKNLVAVKGLLQIAEECNIPTIVTQGAFYLTQEEAAVCNELRLKNGNKTLTGDQCYFKNSEEMIKLFLAYPEALKNTSRVAKQCCCSKAISV